jgi:hypothetical protein
VLCYIGSPIMDLWTLFIAFVGIAALLVQGISCFSKPAVAPAQAPGEAPGQAPNITNTAGSAGRRVIGTLNVILATVATVAVIWLRSGTMVIAPQFGAVMVQGEWNTWMLRAALVGGAVLPALCWHRIRMINQWKPRLPVLLSCGAATGILAAFQVLPINPADAEALRVHSYDVWWPPMIVWFAICAAGTIQALVKARLDSGCSLFAAALVAGLAAFALEFADLPDNPSLPFWLHWFQSTVLWIFIKHFSCGLCAVLLVYEVETSQQPDTVTDEMQRLKNVLSKKIFWIETGVVLVVMFLPKLIITFLPHPWPLLAKLTYVESLPPIFIGLVLLGGIIYEIAEGKQWKAENAPPLVNLARKVLKNATISRVKGVLIALAVPVIGYCLLDFLSLDWLPRAIVIATMFAFWLFFAEGLAEGALDRVPKTFEEITKSRVVVAVRKSTVSAFTKTGAAAKWAAEKFGDAKWPFQALILAITPVLVLAFVVALNEIQNYQAVVVHPLDWTGAGDDKDGPDKDFGRLLANGVINELGLLKRDLRSDLSVAQRVASERGRTAPLLSATASDSGVESAVAKSDDVTIAGVKIQLGFFIRPIQSIIDGFLGIRVVTGSLRKSGDQYTVLLNSSDGWSWKERSESPALAPDKSAADSTSSEGRSKNQTAKSNRPTDAKTGGDTNSGKTTNEVPNTKPVVKPTRPVDLKPAADMNPPFACPLQESPTDTVEGLIQELAFDVASTDPAFVAAGMTKKPKAFWAFHTGLEYWSKVDLDRNPVAEDDLKTAVACFRLSEREDRTFAPAEYRLGVALLRQWQAGAAVAKFRASLEGNPEFVPAALLEARTLYEFSNYSWNQTAVLPPLEAQQFQLEGLRIWATIVSLPSGETTLEERRKAYAGICQAEVDLRLNEPEAQSSYLPYYFCSRAEAIYLRLPTASRQDDEERSREAIVLNNLAISLGSHRDAIPIPAPTQGGPWECEGWAPQPVAASARPVQTARNVRAAMEIYRRAALFSPRDVWIRCNAENAAARLGNMVGMERLESEPGAHLSLANFLFDRATRRYDPDSPDDLSRNEAVGLFKRALDEYQLAIYGDPSPIEALNGYAYTVWRWQVNWLFYWIDRPEAAPTPDLMAVAERDAREALRLAPTHSVTEDQLMTTSTLGEILIAQGRTAEAMDELQAIVGNRWTGQAETRWDLIGAQICAARARRDKASTAQLYRNATTVLQQIQMDDQNPELPSFLTPRDVWDRIVSMSCPVIPVSSNPAGSPAVYKLEKTIYTASPWCDWTMAEMEVYDGNQRVHGFGLRVWGGGIDGFKWDNNGDPIPLETPPANRSGRYFAELRSPENAVSDIVSFDTRKACSKASVKLVFRKSR